MNGYKMSEITITILYRVGILSNIIYAGDMYAIIVYNSTTAVSELVSYATLLN